MSAGLLQLLLTDTVILAFLHFVILRYRRELCTILRSNYESLYIRYMKTTNLLNNSAGNSLLNPFVDLPSLGLLLCRCWGPFLTVPRGGSRICRRGLKVIK